MAVVGQQLVGFSLPGVDGTVSFANYRSRRNLVIVLAVGEGRERWRSLLQELASRYQEIRDLEAEVIAVFPNQSAADEADLPFPRAWDPGGVLTKNYASDPLGHEASALLVTDRFGEVYQYDLFDPARPVPELDSVLASLLYIEKQCPECGAPVWQSE